MTDMNSDRSCDSRRRLPGETTADCLHQSGALPSTEQCPEEMEAKHVG